MNKDIVEQTIEEIHYIAFKIIQYFFISTNICLSFLFYYITNYNFFAILRLFIIFLIDNIIRLLEIFSYSNQDNYYKDIAISFMESSQFLLIISFINKGFINSDNYVNRNTIKIFEYIILELSFLIITFPIEQFYFNDNHIFYTLKCIFSFLGLFLFNKYIMQKFKEFLDSMLSKMKLTICLFTILVSIPKIAYYLYFMKFFLNFIQIYLKNINEIYISYLKMAIISIKEAGKYSICIFLGGLLYIYESNPEFSTKRNDIYSVTVSQDVD